MADREVAAALVFRLILPSREGLEIPPACHRRKGTMAAMVMQVLALALEVAALALLDQSD